MTNFAAGRSNFSSDQIFYRYDYAENRLYSATVVGGLADPSFFLPMAGCKNKFAASSDKSIVLIHWDGISPKATLICNLTTIEQNRIYANNYLDAGSVDPKGRLVAGTFRRDACVATSEANATLYLFKKDGEIVPLIHNLDTIGGMAWNVRKKLFYFFDSCKFTIIEYKWCPRTGKIRKR